MPSASPKSLARSRAPLKGSIDGKNCLKASTAKRSLPPWFLCRSMIILVRPAAFVWLMKSPIVVEKDMTASPVTSKLGMLSTAVTPSLRK